VIISASQVHAYRARTKKKARMQHAGQCHVQRQTAPGRDSAQQPVA